MTETLTVSSRGQSTEVTSNERTRRLLTPLKCMIIRANKKLKNCFSCSS